MAADGRQCQHVTAHVSSFYSLMTCCAGLWFRLKSLRTVNPHRRIWCNWQVTNDSIPLIDGTKDPKALVSLQAEGIFVVVSLQWPLAVFFSLLSGHSPQPAASNLLIHQGFGLHSFPFVIFVAASLFSLRIIGHLQSTSKISKINMPPSNQELPQGTSTTLQDHLTDGQIRYRVPLRHCSWRTYMSLVHGRVIVFAIKLLKYPI